VKQSDISVFLAVFQMAMLGPANYTSWEVPLPGLNLFILPFVLCQAGLLNETIQEMVELSEHSLFLIITYI
jgi:hypothetical protein